MFKTSEDHLKVIIVFPLWKHNSEIGFLILILPPSITYTCSPAEFEFNVSLLALFWQNLFWIVCVKNSMHSNTSEYNEGCSMLLTLRVMLLSLNISSIRYWWLAFHCKGWFRFIISSGKRHAPFFSRLLVWSFSGEWQIYFKQIIQAQWNPCSLSVDPDWLPGISEIGGMTHF